MNKLEETMAHILKTYGHDVLIIHTDSKQNCSCYDPVTSSPNTKVNKSGDREPLNTVCPYCFGTGMSSEIKKYRTRYKDARIPQSNAFMKQLFPFGEYSMDAKVYYFDKHVIIREKDIIVEVDWEKGRPVYVGNGLFEVAHVDPLRYTGGKINHYRVYTKGNPINKDIRAIRIVRKAGEVQYEIAEKGSHKVENPNPKQNPKDSIELWKREEKE